MVTNNLLCDPAFQRTAVGLIDNAPGPVATMLIADEAHTLGAKSFVANKPEFFERRLALSATPERQHDPDGTEEIFEFFGPQVYEFGLGRGHRVLSHAIRLPRARHSSRRRRAGRVSRVDETDRTNSIPTSGPTPRRHRPQGPANQETQNH